MGNQKQTQWEIKNYPGEVAWFEMEKSLRFFKIASRIASPEIHKFRNKFLLQLKQHFRF